MPSLAKGTHNRNLIYGALLCNNFFILNFLFFLQKTIDYS